MPTNWSFPGLTQLWADFVAAIKGRDESIAKMDFTGDSNLPNGVIRWNVSADRFEKWSTSGFVWVPLSSLYAINVDKVDGLDSSAFAPAAHQTAGGTVHADANQATAGFMSVVDKVKLDNATHAVVGTYLMQRDAGGRAKVSPPIAADDLARKDTVDTHDANIGAHGSTSTPTADRIMRRDGAARAKVGVPAAGDDIARLDTVTNHAAGLGHPAHSHLTSGDGGVLADGVSRQRLGMFVNSIDQVERQFIDLVQGTNITVQRFLTSFTATYVISATGVPSVSVGQGELKTTFGDVASSPNVSVGLPGGRFGFWVTDVSNVARYKRVEIDLGGGKGPGALYTLSGSSNMETVRQTYVQASPPYDLGDGEVQLFVFVLVERDTGRVAGVYAAPEAPWHYGGPTNVKADFVREGKPMRRMKPVEAEVFPDSPEAIDDYLKRLQSEKVEEIEVTQEMKNRDMAVIQQPFSGFNKGRYKVVMLDPVDPLMERLALLHHGNTAVSVVSLLQQGYLKIGNEPLARKGPPGIDIVSVRL